jgi:hypothetical protein
MEAKAIQATRTKLNELAVHHNRLTTLVAVLLNEIKGLKDDMDQIKQLLEGVEVVSNGENEEKSAPTPSVQQRIQPQPQQQQRMMNMTPQQPVQQSKSVSSSRSRNNRNSSLAELHADDIIKQLTMNAE